jgi:MscS family membrane protein
MALSYGFCWLALRAIPERWWTATKPSVAAVLFVGLVLHNLASRLLGLPLLYRVWYSRVLTLLWLIVITWAIFGVIRHLDRRAREYLLSNHLSSTQSMLQLGRRLLQALVLLGAVLSGLKAFGYDITAALAGLGIGGIAVAFAAQKTLENVFGGLTLLSDGSIRVGDSVKFAATVGTVEDIGLRATRFRTVERSMLYVPNGQLAAMNIENLGQRDKILFRHTVGVKQGLEPGAMKELLASLERLLAEDSRVAAEGRRVRFLKIGAYSFEIELFAFIQTSDWGQFLIVQQELLLSVMEIVRRHDTDFAFPSQTLYVEQGQLPASLQHTPVEENVVPSPRPAAGEESAG